ncbi:hypothetical protein, partial [Synechococcus sp. F70.1]|uniref:hypothetical protein n=1 Tax=Synechococcus sp. F70.1 TaxID=2964532 RepID=UPI0039C62FB5
AWDPLLESSLCGQTLNAQKPISNREANTVARATIHSAVIYNRRAGDEELRSTGYFTAIQSNYQSIHQSNGQSIRRQIDLAVSS